ncbi:MAG: HPr kinase/phosphorylase [Clostridiales bacterium GWF2_38_85]|nr:MAG: HPr kinase/phosphorylase [Clostridiales bacterium GWF2_38_85]HBL84140.1 HPr(Ser) kinase/phosphatase [Clostridiales bacterium]
MSNTLEYSIKLTEVAAEFQLEEIFIPSFVEEITVKRADVSRPGLPLAGFFSHFEGGRIQIIGNMEHKYLQTLPDDERVLHLEKFISHGVVAVVVSNSLEIFEELKCYCEKYNTPLYRTWDTTSSFMAALIAYLNIALAERITRHGVLVEVYGEGILILGDSGIGKSETAIELVKRGHRLIADDAVELKKVSAKTLVGSAPELIRHYIELRGIGIIDVRRIFGMGAVKLSEKIDLILNLEMWEKGKFYERFGLDDEYTEILGIKIPSITIPVQPGRNLAVIIEIAAMNNRQKKMGYNTALEFNKRLMQNIADNQ